MREPAKPVALSKVVLIVTVAGAITCVLVVGVTYLSPSNVFQATGTAMQNPKIEGTNHNTPAVAPSPYPSMKGKVKATAPWQHGRQ